MISEQEVLEIHAILIERFGGSNGIRDKDLLDSALNRPYQIIGSGGFFTTINTTLVATTTSNPKGFFEIELEPGSYNVFVQEGDNFYANRWTSEGINTVTVIENELAELLFDITYEATY